MKLAISLIITAIIGYAFWYFGLPNFAPGFVSGFWCFIGSIFILFGVLNLIFNIRSEKFRLGITSLICGGSIIGIGLLVSLATTMALFGSVQSYRDVIGKNITTGKTTLSSDLAPIDPRNVRIVDEDLALKIAQQLFNPSGNDSVNQVSNLGSICELGTPALQKVHNKLYHIIPLLQSEHFFTTWRNNDMGTPGYIRISATDPNDKKLFEEVNGKKIHLIYQPSAMFDKDLERHIRQKGYVGMGLTDMTLEVDESDMPWWVVTTYKNTQGVGHMPDVTGVLVVNPETGDIKPYKIGEIPDWIDRVYPANFIEDQIDTYGEYINNKCWFPNKSNAYVTSSEKVGIVYGKDGNCYFYVGLTSFNGNNNATIGFMLVNTRTKETTHYTMGGKNEDDCLKSLEGAVKNFGYSATHPPTLESIDGTITYFATLKDAQGYVKKYGFVDVNNPLVYGIGDDVQSALFDYEARMSTTGNSNVPSENTDIKSINAKVSRFAFDITNGNMQYLVMVEGSNLVFQGRLSTSNELPLTKVGDNVIVTFRQSFRDSSSNAPISHFDNLNIGVFDSKATKDLKQSVEDVKMDQNINKNSDNIQSLIQSMSKKQKDSLYKVMNRK